jgi:hypothetical protein
MEQEELAGTDILLGLIPSYPVTKTIWNSSLKVYHEVSSIE